MANTGTTRPGPVVTEGMLSRDWQAPFPVDVRLTLSVHGRCPADPTFRVDDAGAVWRTSLTPDGPGTIRVLSVGEVPAATVAFQPEAAGQESLAWSRAHGVPVPPGCLTPCPPPLGFTTIFPDSTHPTAFFAK